MSIPSPQFVLDSDVLITAKNKYYAIDICPSFWNSLLLAIQNGQVVIIDKVRDEILAGKDDLATWMRTHVSGLSVSSADALLTSAYSQAMSWVQANGQFTAAAKAGFAKAADGWVAAYASVHNLTVVTLETFDEGAKKRVKLPNVCCQPQVDWVDTFEMLRRLGVNF